MWVFGYGSLMWYTNFPYVDSAVGFVQGYLRRFCQASPDHRGTHEEDRVYGVVYKVEAEHVAEVKEYLNWREKAGYTWHSTMFYSSDRQESFPVEVFMSLESNKYHMNDEEYHLTAERIISCAGESGTSLEYFLRVLDCLKKIEDQQHADPYLEQLRKHVAKICDLSKLKQDPKLSKYLHMLED